MLKDKPSVMMLAIIIGQSCFNKPYISQNATLDEQSIALYTPWRKPRRIQWRQVVSATEAGRFFHTLSLLYYPQQPSGLVDLERVQHLFLPTVVDQEDLLEAIEARILP